MTEEKTKFTQEEWMEEGKKRFGENMLKWKFECPQCKNVTSPEDFKPYADRGADPNSAFQECIGRYDKNKGCDWCAYGLFRGPWVVTTTENEKVYTFPFASPDREETK